MVQHHHAHLASAMAESGHPDDQPVIGFAFDGTGYGDDQAVWGGEFMIADYGSYRRAGHLRYTLCRAATPACGTRAGWPSPTFAPPSWPGTPGCPSVAACTEPERSVLARQLETGLNSVPTSSMGRLFDAVSSLAGTCQRIAYEAEAAMRFEGLARSAIEAPARVRVHASDTMSRNDHRRSLAGAPRGGRRHAGRHTGATDRSSLPSRGRRNDDHDRRSTSGPHHDQHRGAFRRGVSQRLLTRLCVDRLLGPGLPGAAALPGATRATPASPSVNSSSEQQISGGRSTRCA